ncbi:MAG: flavodoxin [Planctomycetaceae bacterium]|jgi:flavodoxin short chain|nr:flavodoxin [Planctomycetaceae bacterium]
MKISIIYWSGTGNTESMAKLIQEGAVSAGAEVVLKEVGKATPADVTDADVAILGCPSMGDEVLEEGDFEPFISSVEDKISGKKLALFGSYGWGDGQWMRDWTDRMKKAGAVLVAESLIVNEAPSGDDEEKCKTFGKSVV